MPLDDFAAFPNPFMTSNVSTGQEGVELAHDAREVDLGIHHNPVVLAVGTAI